VKQALGAGATSKLNIDLNASKPGSPARRFVLAGAPVQAVCLHRRRLLGALPIRRVLGS
jgi:hypothetical protein